MPRRAPAPPLTHAQKFMQEDFPRLIGKLREEFRVNSGAPESSVEEESSDFHILYFPVFSEFYKLNIGHDVEVSSKTWALAFLQDSLSSTVQVLSKAAFTPESLSRLASETVAIVVRRAALWMNTKCVSHIDPWSYTFDDGNCSVDATYEEEEEIQRTLESFTRGGDEDRELMPPPPPSKTTIASLITLTLLDIQNELEGMSPSDFENRTLSQLDAEEDKQDQYLRVFNQFLAWIKAKGIENINAAQVVGALTKATIPKNTDLFVDAVQVSNARWTHAYVQKDLCSIARKLYAQMYRRDYTRGGLRLNSLWDMCPIKRLSIYRGAKWLWELKHNRIAAQTSDFTSEIEEHNVYPTIEERRMIDAGIWTCVQEIDGTNVGLHQFLNPDEDGPTKVDTLLDSIASSTCVVFEEANVTPMDPDNHADLITINPSEPLLPPPSELVTKFSQDSWTRAENAFLKEGEERETNRAGRVLFLALYGDEDILKYRTTKREGKQPFPVGDVTAILDAIKYFHDAHPGRAKVTWSDAKRMTIRRDVFIDIAKQERDKVKNRRAGHTN